MVRLSFFLFNSNSLSLFSLNKITDKFDHLHVQKIKASFYIISTVVKK